MNIILEDTNNLNNPFIPNAKGANEFKEGSAVVEGDNSSLTSSAPKAEIKKSKFLRFGIVSTQSIGLFAFFIALRFSIIAADSYIPNSLENKILPTAPLTLKEASVKKQIEDTHAFAQNLFKSSPKENIVANINLKFRLNEIYKILGKYVSSTNNTVHAIPIFKYVNMPIYEIIKEEQYAVGIKTIRNQLENRKISHDEYFKKEDILNANAPLSGLNLFSFFPKKNMNLVYDYYYLHEFSHVVLKKEVDKETGKLIAKWKNDYGIELKKPQQDAFSETVADNLGAILTIKRHNLSVVDAQNFFAGILLYRKTENDVLQLVAEKQKESNSNDHNTISSVRLLKRQFMKNPTAFKNMPLEKAIELSLELAHKDFYYTVYSSFNYSGELQKLKESMKKDNPKMPLENAVEVIDKEIRTLEKKQMRQR